MMEKIDEWMDGWMSRQAAEQTDKLHRQNEFSPYWNTAEQLCVCVYVSVCGVKRRLHEQQALMAFH